MLALIRDNQLDANDAWSPSEDALVSSRSSDMKYGFLMKYIYI